MKSKVAKAFKEHDEKGITEYREMIAELAHNVFQQADYLNMPMFQYFCMGMSIAYTMALVDSGELTKEDLKAYHDFEDKKFKGEKSNAVN